VHGGGKWGRGLRDETGGEEGEGGEEGRGGMGRGWLPLSRFRKHLPGYSSVARALVSIT
jgi:hypothetical protein